MHAWNDGEPIPNSTIFFFAHSGPPLMFQCNMYASLCLPRLSRSDPTGPHRTAPQAAGVYHQVKSEIDIHVNYGSGCPNIVRCYGYFYDEKRWDGTGQDRMG